MKFTFSSPLLLSVALIFALLAPQLSQSQNREFKKETEIIFKSIKTKNYQSLKPLLDPAVKISDKIPTGINDIVFPQVLAQMPELISYTITKTELVGANYKVTADFKYTPKTLVHYFTFNPAGKIIEFDILSEAKKVESHVGGR